VLPISTSRFGDNLHLLSAADANGITSFNRMCLLIFSALPSPSGTPAAELGIGGFQP
jgi:hypothetical protein